MRNYRFFLFGLIFLLFLYKIHQKNTTMNDFENNNYDFDFLENEKQSEEPEKNKTGMVKPILTVLLLMLLVGGAIYYFSGDDKEKPEAVENTENTEPVTEQADSLAVEAYDNTNAEGQVSDSITENNNEIATGSGQNDEASETTSSENELKYFVVAGAFSVEDNANRKTESLKQAGYNALIAGQNANGLFIVAYEGFSDMQNAKEKLAEIREQNSSAWIYIK